MSETAKNLLSNIEKYIEESSKTNYRFTDEEQYKLQRAIEILNNQIDILIDYEIKRSQKKEDE